MTNKKYQLNSRNILISLVKIVLIILGAYILTKYTKDSLEKPIMYGAMKITPHEILVIYVCLFITIQVTRILRNCIWEYYLPLKRNVQMSTLLISLINFSIYVSCVFVLCKYVLGFNLESALAATGAVGVVLGFGLQKMFLDLFVGISIDMDKSFQMGDWVHLRNANMDIVGRIIQMNWRIISVQTVENSVHQIPNNVFGQQIVTNLSKPVVASEFELLYCIPFQYNEKTVIATITHALDAVAGTGIISDYKCVINKTDINGVTYKIKYMLDPSKCAPGKSRHLIHSRVFRFLRAAKIELANTNQRMFITRLDVPEIQEEETIADLISKVDLFQTLKKPQIASIAQSTFQRTYNKGDVICHQGDEGRSLFIVREGFLKVYIHTEQEEHKQVGVLIPEDFFGEMSLLTGDVRSATVVAESNVTLYEIRADALIPVFSENDKFYKIVSKIIAERHKINADASKSKEAEVHHKSMLRELEEKILNFSKKLLGIRS